MYEGDHLAYDVLNVFRNWIEAVDEITGNLIINLKHLTTNIEIFLVRISWEQEEILQIIV